MVAGIVPEELGVKPVVSGPEVACLCVVTAVGDVVGDGREDQAGGRGIQE
jgi:hypothetical protein